MEVVEVAASQTDWGPWIHAAVSVVGSVLVVGGGLVKFMGNVNKLEIRIKSIEDKMDRLIKSVDKLAGMETRLTRLETLYEARAKTS